MFQVNDKDVKKLERKLRDINERAIPFATRATINEMAFGSQALARTEIQAKITLRNQ